MKKLFLVFFLSSPIVSVSQQKDPDLLGVVSAAALEKEPYNAWFAKGLAEYTPNATALSELKKYDLSKVRMTLVFGSWCGDSKRELPRMIKLLRSLNFSEKNITLLGVEDSINFYKQSPGGETTELGVYRVPTLIFYEKNKEIGRLVEFPVVSLERDFREILANRYTPNYFSYAYVKKWMSEGLLVDENTSPRGLAMQLLGKVSGEGELNACGYVLMAQGKLREAIMILRVNANLFTRSSNCFDSLAEAYLKAGEKEKAIQAFEMAVRLDGANTHALDELKKLGVHK